MSKMKRTTFLILLGLIYFSLSVNAQSIRTTKHNLSVTSPGTIKATTESEICIFCHTPHNSTPKVPLWNRNVAGSVYTLYTSSTLNATEGQPDGASILCLSCHDGSIALGSVVSRISPIDMTLALSSDANLSTDLSNDHPISFLYNSTLATSDGQLRTPPLTTTHLDNNSKLQCSSCHDPHKDLYPNFLLASNLNSGLCILCHSRTYWASCTHASSSKTWNGSGLNPWAHIETPYPTVSQNACANCHNVHNANGKLRLLKLVPEESNCLDCHNGNVASKNIQSQFAKIYKHNIYGYNNIHDPAEATSVTTKHVECQDCHNSHASNASTATAPFVSGYNVGVSGINQSGVAVSSVSNTYEICYKCHAGNSWSPPAALPRKISQNNVRLEFATGNPSFHPVVGSTITNSPSIIPPLTTGSKIYCTNCHGSDNSSDPRGPHGSLYPQILKLQYTSIDNTVESPTAYALCYSCHSRTSILSDNTFKKHFVHVVTAKTPCSVCHDAHGISNIQGNSTNNSHLINFRTDVVVGIGALLRLEFVDRGDRSGYCVLKCHNKVHGSGMSY
ncbi:MAG TPA: hypothetical protein DCG69_03335 [Bacteroidales bacterium]|nr:hypothetical protein [Bacteroidales bacterium]